MPSSDPTRGIRALTFAFALSQFFRTCLAVIAPELQHDLGLSPAGFGTLSSCFFLAFAVAQIPIGVAFDRYGVGAPTRLLSAVGVIAALLFVVAPNGATAMVAQVGLGLACAPVFMGLMHYASEQLPVHRYATVVGRANAISMVGALCATVPLGWAAHSIGWRPAMALAAIFMLLACIGVWRGVRDEGHAEARHEPTGALLMGSARLLTVPALWTLIPLCVALAAGTTFRNAWGGPYLADVFRLDAGARGLALAFVSLGGFLTALLLPVLVRRSSIKTTLLCWTLMSMASGTLLALFPDAGLLPGVLLLTLLATVGMVHPMVMAHGRGLVPQSLRGRGLGVLNTFVFLGSAATSWFFGLIADASLRNGWTAAGTYSGIFLCATGMVLLGALVYTLSPKPLPH
ncbi:MFS transporter [Variovorax sp. LT1R16]|uniref:MFS transporter n=1 Tax=Variovorax sp. LT1R16 TaxID=3443728 RepID=UPI003F44ABAC